MLERTASIRACRIGLLSICHALCVSVTASCGGRACCAKALRWPRLLRWWCRRALAAAQNRCEAFHIYWWPLYDVVTLHRGSQASRSTPLSRAAVPPASRRRCGSRTSCTAAAPTRWPPACGKRTRWVAPLCCCYSRYTLHELRKFCVERVSGVPATGLWARGEAGGAPVPFRACGARVMVCWYARQGIASKTLPFLSGECSGWPWMQPSISRTDRKLTSSLVFFSPPPPQQALFEASLGRKYRSHPTVFQGTGRAGDTSTTKGAPRRNEDRPEFFKDLNRDSPTFLKYLANLPAKAATSPHHRRQLWETQRQRAAADGDRRLVASLKIAGVTDD